MTRTAQRVIANLTRGAAVLALLQFFALSSTASSIEEYKTKVDSARTSAIKIENSIRNNEIGGSHARGFAEQVRRDFPVSERIEWEGGTVETSSGWLLDRSKALEGETDLKKQLVTVVEIREQLSAISFKLLELEQATQAERTKDQEKQKLAEILRREEYQKPQQKQESVVERWIRSFLEWLESIFPKPSVPGQGISATPVLTTVLQFLLYAALAGLLGFLAYKIVPLIFPKLRRSQKPKKKKQRTILGEQLGEDVTSVDLFDEAERLAREGNMRGAIRKGYIALLCDLSDRKVIGLAGNKTNRDYLRDVRARRELHPRLKSVTDTFERHWYGFEESAEQDWTRFRDEYKEAIRSV